ncbi:carboxypeptidase-like regulatory domain-containing protein [Fibrobacter sp. UWEL]|uniref:carboxypeptidase-like regulatory domain-containing protein n=1 Tax=Fibrobacter sp. UWEL TaxID=1896209 RepID=UPI000911F7B4|nr:carboxypeptidase-like regulatory domain-containing protein [Fibrobacter sp. UWEL]SHK80658.1 hypothetical protein SAMN05720468_10747 [Fibrobacter sp. UWEL]
MKFLLTSRLSRALTACGLLSGLFSLMACSTDSNSVANGTGSNAGETEIATTQIAGTITATSADGAPLARATARIWTLNEDTISVAFTDTLDSKGQLDFAAHLEKNQVSGRYLLEANSGDTLSVMRWVNFNKKPAQKLSADSTTSLKGTITNRSAAVAGATITILDKQAVTDPSGNFQITGVPAGVHYAFVEGNFGKFSYQMQTGLDSNGQTNNIDIGDSIFTVIEDFENWTTKQTLLGKSFGDGWWFICTDSLQGGGSRAEIGINSDSLLVSGSEAHTGSSLHLKFNIDWETEGRYGVAGFTIGDDFEETDSYSFFDLRQATAISFDARGSGELFLQITKRGENGEREYYENTPVNLSEEWQHFTFTAEDFNTELIAVNSLNFMVRDNADFYLDNIRLDGISPSMWPSLGMEF